MPFELFPSSFETDVKESCIHSSMQQMWNAFCQNGKNFYEILT